METNYKFSMVPRLDGINNNNDNNKRKPHSGPLTFSIYCFGQKISYSDRQIG